MSNDKKLSKEAQEYKTAVLQPAQRSLFKVGQPVYICDPFSDFHEQTATIRSVEKVDNLDIEGTIYLVEVVKDCFIETDYVFHDEISSFDHKPSSISFEMMIEMAKQGILPAP